MEFPERLSELLVLVGVFLLVVLQFVSASEHIRVGAIPEGCFQNTLALTRLLANTLRMCGRMPQKKTSHLGLDTGLSWRSLPVLQHFVGKRNLFVPFKLRLPGVLFLCFFSPKKFGNSAVTPGIQDQARDCFVYRLQHAKMAELSMRTPKSGNTNSKVRHQCAELHAVCWSREILCSYA